ncbi:hypothetical protein Scep_026530 [Stephania cephalantha]|uniref:Uncharacterized protein n=1 Tax=Stephania cephalantha TaxID=152367 RepID=A0AAP0EKB3_9MAGN
MDVGDLVEGASADSAEKAKGKMAGEGRKANEGRRQRGGSRNRRRRGGGRCRGERGGWEQRGEGRRSVQRERKMDKISNSVLAARRESKPAEEGRRLVQRRERTMGAERSGEVACAEREEVGENLSK